MLSDEICALLYRLRERPVLGELLRDDPRRALLATLGGTGEWRAVPPLMPLIAANDTLSPIAARTAGALLRGISPSQLAWVDAEARRYLAPEPTHSAWRDLPPAAVPALVGNLRPEWTAIGLLSSHWNGYVRQAAVSALGVSDDGTEIPFLALRANDWVPNVSVAAAALLMARLVLANRVQVLEAIPFIARLLGQQRRNHEPLATAFATVLLGADFNLLETRLRAVETPAARFVYSLLLAAAPADHPLLLAALGAADPGVRQAAVKKYASRTDIDAAARLIRIARTDSAPGVRKQALSAVAEYAPDSLRPLLPEFLLDRSARIRMLAQYLAGKLDPALDLKSLYRARMNDGSRTRRAAAIAGLGECGTRDDALQVEPALNDGSSRIRRTSLRALARLDAVRALPAAMSALEDPSPSVRAAADATVLAQRHRVDFRALHDRWRHAADPDIRGGMLVLLAHAPKWDAVVYLLEAVADSNEHTRAHASGLLDEWVDAFNHSHLQPSTAHLTRIRVLCEGHATALRTETARFLRSIIS